jgi:hypothetical protein
MHHTLRFYGRNRHLTLRLYMSLAKLTRIPLAGRLVRRIANLYGQTGHGGFAISLSEAEQIVDASQNVSLGPCSCRQVFHNCDTPIMNEIVLGNSPEEYADKSKQFRQISKEEAKEILRQAHRNRLTQGIMRCGHHFYAICNCCSCCCVPTRLREKYGIGAAFRRSKNVVQEFKNSLD